MWPLQKVRLESLLLNSSLKKDIFKNVRTQCYDILHLSSQTQHSCRGNTERLTRLIISSLVDTYMHLCPCFFMWVCVCLMRASKPAGAQQSGCCPCWVLWCLSLQRDAPDAHQAATTCCPPTPSAPCSRVSYRWGSLCLIEHLLTYSCLLKHWRWQMLQRATTISFLNKVLGYNF